MKFLSKKGGSLSIIDALAIAGTKTFSERFLSRYIGNATVMSGSIKVAGAIVSNGLVGGKFGDIVGTALMVDGAEDIVNNLIGTFLPKAVGGVQSGDRVII